MLWLPQSDLEAELHAEFEQVGLGIQATLLDDFRITTWDSEQISLDIMVGKSQDEEKIPLPIGFAHSPSHIGINSPISACRRSWPIRGRSCTYTQPSWTETFLLISEAVIPVTLSRALSKALRLPNPAFLATTWCGKLLSARNLMA